MPSYSYQCQNCQEKFNIEATIKEKEGSDVEKFKCPKCQSAKITQQFSAANFVKNVFKGNSGKSSGGCCPGGGCQCG